MLHILSSTLRALTQNNSYHSFWGRDEVWYHWISKKVLHAYNVHKTKGFKINTKPNNKAVLTHSIKICAKYHKPLYTLMRLILKIETQHIFPRYMVSPELALYYTTIYKRSISVLPFTNSSDTHQALRQTFASYSSVCAPAARSFWADKRDYMHQSFDNTFATMNTSAAGGVFTAPGAEMLAARNTSAQAMAPRCSWTTKQ